MGIGFGLTGGPSVRFGPHGCLNLARGRLVSLIAGPGGRCGSGGLDGADYKLFFGLIYFLDFFFFAVFCFICIFVLDGFVIRVDRTYLIIFCCFLHCFGIFYYV